MTRRGRRSEAAMRKRVADWNRYLTARVDSMMNGVIRWERGHGEMKTDLVAYCGSCWQQRVDVEPQVCNARHPDGRLRAELIMLAVASYGSCKHCGATEIGDIRTCAEMGTPGITHIYP